MDITSKSNITLEFDKVKEELSKYAKFEQSKVLCLRLSPFNDVNKIQKEIELTREAKKFLIMQKILQPSLLLILVKLNPMQQFLIFLKMS